MKKSIARLLALVIAVLSIVNPYYAVHAEVTVSSIIDGTLYAIGGSFYLTKETFRTGLNILSDIPSVEKISEHTSQLVEETCSYAETISQKINGQDTELVNISPDDSPIQYNPNNHTFVYHPTYISNYNQVVQESVTKLDGYYLLDTYIDAVTLRNICESCEKSEENITKFLEHVKEYPYTYILLPDGVDSKDYCISYGSTKEFCGIIKSVEESPSRFSTFIGFCERSDGSFLYVTRATSDKTYTVKVSEGIYDSFDSSISMEEAFGAFRCYSGSPFKVFYSELDFKNYQLRGRQYYAPNLPGNLSIPAQEINDYPTFISNEYNNVVNSMDSGLNETDIQNMIDTSIENYINIHQPPAVTDVPNPTATPEQSTSIDYTNILNNIYNTLKSFVSGHSIFESQIFTYFESNNGKLNELITAVNQLDTGQTSGEINGCKYDFTQLSDFFTSIWEESSGKYDHIADLLSQNTQYQKQMIQALDDMSFPPLYDYTDTLKSLDNTINSFVSGHSSFENNIFTYFENSNGKLDELITAVDKLDSGQLSGVENGCKYDYTELAGLLTSLWDKSMGKYDRMIALLEENNQYQQQLMDTLDSIKNLLLFDTAIDLLKDRALQTADTAKGKFPTSLPWDVALVVNAMCATPETPIIRCLVEIKSLNIQEEFIIDLSGGEWAKLAKTCRSLLSLLFVLYMIHLTRQLITGGDEK